MIEEVVSKRKCVPPSAKVEKVKRKISESFKKQDEQITTLALQETIEKIYKWIASHNQNRLPIKGKSIGLFAKNQGAAKASKKVEEIAQMLQKNQTTTLL